MLMNPGSVHVPDRGDRSAGIGDIATLVRGMFDVLRRRYIVLATVAVLVFGLFVLALLLMTPRYEATARVKVDPKPVAMNGIGSDQNVSLPDQSLVDTEVSVMRSRDIAQAVVNQFHLDRDPEFTKAIDKSDRPMTPAERNEAVITAVTKNLDVNREKATYLIGVGFRSVSPEKAAAIANAFADGYIKETISRRAGTAEQQYSWLDRRLDELASQARSADSALAQYKGSNGLTEGGQLGTVTDQQIAPLSNQLSLSQAAAAAARSDLAVARAQMASGGASAASSVLNSPAIQTLRSNRATVQQTLSQLSSRYGPKHPQTIQAQEQLSAIDTQINEEAQRIIGELQAKASAATAQVDSLSGGLSRLRSEQASNARSAVTADSLQRDADAKHNAYNRVADITQQIDQAAQNSVSQSQIIERATPPLKPSSPKKLLILGAGFVIALTAALGLVTALELMNPGLLTTADVEQQLGLKVLAAIPMLPAKEVKAGGSPAEMLMSRPMSPYAESLRTIRGALTLAGDHQAQLIALMSTLPGEGKTTASLSLARVMAMSGDRTLIIDGDLRRAGLSALIQHRPEIGLVEVLRDGAPWQDAIIQDETPGLDLLTSSEKVFLPADLFGGPAMANLLKILRGRYDKIIIDTPPLLGVADARTIAALSDTVVLMLKWNSTPSNAAKAALDQLRLDNAPIGGAVLSMVSPKAEAFGALYYSQAYAHYYQQS